MGFGTRKIKLKNKLKDEIEKSHPDLDKLIEIVEEYQKDNINTIDKLKRKKKITLNKINGGLKQSINSHGPITKELIGSTSKRIFGSFLEPEEESKFDIISFIEGVIVTLIIYLII